MTTKKIQHYQVSQPVITLTSIFIMFLTVYIVIAILADIFMTLPSEVSRLIHISDIVISIIFMRDFVRQYRKAPDKKAYFLGGGWIDLLASLPAIGFLRFGRIFRLIRILRVIKVFRSFRGLIKYLFKDRYSSLILSGGMIAFLMVIIGSVTILLLETTAQSNIKTAEDALRWVFVTISTVGYGDHYPVTTGGRILALILMSLGVGLFGVFSAYLTKWLMGVDTNVSTDGGK